MKTRTIAAAAVAALALATASGVIADQRMGGKMGKGRRVPMMAFPPAEKAGLQDATGHANVDVKRGTVYLTVTLAKGTSLPQGTVLEGWLTTAGISTASERDQKYGPAFGKEDVAMKSRQIPYALSTGLLRRVGSSRTYAGRFKIDNALTPYGGVAVTLESDGNKGIYDPRPGTPLMGGMIKSNLMKSKMTMSGTM